MKLNNGGYDKETTLEFFNSHIPSPFWAAQFTELEGVTLLESCGKPQKEGVVIEHVDTYLNDSKTSWRVQVREKYSTAALADNWSFISNIIKTYGLSATVKKTGEMIRVQCTNNGVIITYTFGYPYVEKVPEFQSLKEERHWVIDILKQHGYRD